MKYIVIYIVVISLLLLITGQLTYATNIVPATLEAMTTLSELIVVGQVTEQHSYWEQQNIYTDVVIAVEKVYKPATDPPPSEIIVKVLGGEADGIVQNVDMGATFTTGEKTMLFLENPQDGKYRPFAMSYGVYSVIVDNTTQEEIIQGPYFDFPEHIDLSTNTTVPVAAEVMQDAEEVRCGMNFENFVQQVSRFIQ